MVKIFLHILRVYSFRVEWKLIVKPKFSLKEK